jgi:signal transduction histidine kinase
LDQDVNRIFDQGLRLSKSFPDTQRGENYDEIAQLRHHIYQLLSELEGYERYLKQLPKMLRHELHNPLNRLTMALSLLEKEYDPQQVQYANRAIEQLKKIINALSEASSIEESLERQEPESYPLDEMLNAYFENLNETPLKAHLKTDCRLPSPTCVLGDGFMMEQLLDKLISNAKDFKTEGSLIEIRCYGLDDKNRVRIEVRNKGPFIPDNSEQRIFDGMTSIRPVNSDEETHLGLGLYIAKLIAEYHGGKIWATNDYEHKEVVFNLEVPVQDPSLCSL